MNLIKRTWTAEEADVWTKEDWLAVIFSSLAYVAIMVGMALAILLIPVGFVVLVFGILCAVFMFWVIDPKLKAISEDYEHKQKEYLKRLEEIETWKQ
ncbi:MAG: hypothetical protein HY747_10710 [Elusimicrobia bacterium]|nr:hypothetical protein [Elusimicrobiota bacterium]